MRGLDRREFLVLSAGALACAAGTPALGALAAGRRSAEGYLGWEEVRDGVFATTDPGSGGNAMVLVSEGRALLVDTKFPAFAAALVRQAQGAGGELETIVNTHHHADHTGGNAVLADRGVLVAHAKVAERVAAQVERYIRSAQGGASQIDMSREGAEEILEEAQAAAGAASGWEAEDFAPDTGIETWPHELRCGAAAVTLHHFGAGHTDNDVAVRLPDANVLHAGDLCFNGMHPYFDPDGGATCRGWSESVAKTIELCDGETVVIPGHGALTDRSGLEAQKRYLDALWDHVAKEIRKGRARDEVVEMRWDFMEGLERDSLRPRAIGAVYDEIRGA